MKSRYRLSAPRTATVAVPHRTAGNFLAHAIELSPTFMGAHDVPVEYRGPFQPIATSLSRSVWHRVDVEMVLATLLPWDLQTRLEDTRAEVVRAMAKLQSMASRAQAASAMAEAEVALQTMKSGVSADPPEAAQVTSLVRQSAAAFHRGPLFAP